MFIFWLFESNGNYSLNSSSSHFSRTLSYLLNDEQTINNNFFYLIFNISIVNFYWIKKCCLTSLLMFVCFGYNFCLFVFFWKKCRRVNCHKVFICEFVSIYFLDVVDFFVCVWIIIIIKDLSCIVFTLLIDVLNIIIIIINYYCFRNLLWICKKFCFLCFCLFIKIFLKDFIFSL